MRFSIGEHLAKTITFFNEYIIETQTIQHDYFITGVYNTTRVLENIF